MDWRDNQDSLQRLRDFLKLPPHVFANEEMPWMNDPMESVRASVNDATNMDGGSIDTEVGDCLMDDKESMDDALEEAMAMELDIDQSLQEDDSFPSRFQSKGFGSGDEEAEEEKGSCSIEHPLRVTVPDDSFTCSNGLHSELELRQERSKAEDHMFNDRGTLEPMQSESLEPKIHSESPNASFSSDWEVVTPQSPYIMPWQKPNPNTSPTLNDSVLTDLARPMVRDGALWNVSVAAIKRKLMHSMNSEQSSPSPCPPPVRPYRTPPTTMETNTCGLEQTGSCSELAHIQSLDGGECCELTMCMFNGAQA